MSKHSLFWQFLCALERLYRIGSSKKEARKATGKRNPPGIYSLSAMHDYKRFCRYFVRWLREKHPEVKSMEEAFVFVAEFVSWLVESGKSAHTVHSYLAAIAKAYGIPCTDFPDLPPLPPRSRDNITRSRGPAARDAEFSEKSHQPLVDFCRATGCRREDVCNARADNFYISAGGTLYHHVVQGKGGRPRELPVLEEYRPAVETLIEEARINRGDHGLLFPYVSGKADIHGYRRAYAQELYRLCEQDHEYRDRLYAELDVDGYMPSSCASTERYSCRHSAKGISFDRRSLRVVAVALGHGAGREGTVVNNYLIDTLSLRS